MDSPSNHIEKLREIAERSISKKSLIVLAVVAGLLLFTDLAVISTLIVLSLVTPLAVKKMGIKMLGIELATLTTVLIAVEMGATAGAVAGFLLMTEHLIAGQFSGAYILWVIPSYAVAGFIAGTVSLPLATLGIALSAGLNVLFTAATALTTPENLHHQIPHALGNIAFNSALFLYAAPLLASMI